MKDERRRKLSPTPSNGTSFEKKPGLNEPNQGTLTEMEGSLSTVDLLVLTSLDQLKYYLP